MSAFLLHALLSTAVASQTPAEPIQIGVGGRANLVWSRYTLPVLPAPAAKLRTCLVVVGPSETGLDVDERGCGSEELEAVRFAVKEWQLEQAPDSTAEESVMAVLVSWRFGEATATLSVFEDNLVDPGQLGAGAPGLRALPRAKVKRSASPEYPLAARSMDIEDPSCAISVVFDEKGKVVSADPFACPTVFEDSASKAAKAFRFEPIEVGGEAVPGFFELRIKYVLR